MQDEYKPLNKHKKEQKLYGRNWNTVHGGYFADPLIASPLVEAILDAAYAVRPAVIADLGGATGFLLSEVESKIDLSPPPKLVCVDAARAQLDCCPDPISTLECEIEDVERGMLVEPGKKLMLCMRSVLHYRGAGVLDSKLLRFRSMLEPGEYLVHQTICFPSEIDASVGNLLYERMKTGKWFPTAGFLMDSLKRVGFEIIETRPAAPIALTSTELEKRYDIDHDTMMSIGEEMERRCGGQLSTVYQRSRTGFTAYLEYVVMTCVAV